MQSAFSRILLFFIIFLTVLTLGTAFGANPEEAQARPSLENQYFMYSQAIEWLQKNDEKDSIYVQKEVEMMSAWCFFEDMVNDERTKRLVKEGYNDYLKHLGHLADSKINLHKIWKPNDKYAYRNIAIFSNIHHNMLIATLEPYDRKIGVRGQPFIFDYLFIFDNSYKLTQTIKVRLEVD